MTGPDGTYSIGGIQPGSYPVEFFGGCGNRDSLAPQYYKNQPTEQSAALLSLKANETTPNINALMQAGGSLTGLVTDNAGRRLSGTCVDVTTE